MPNLPQGAKKALKLASSVGGADGKHLAAAVSEALNEPDVREHTQIGTYLDQGLANVGSYNPQRIPLSTKREMRRDAQIRFGLQAVKSPIQQAPLHFVCRSREVQQLLNDVFIESGFLTELLRTSLNAVDYGWQAHEQLWEVGDHEVDWEMPNAEGGVDVKTKTYPNIFLPRRFKDLDPSLVQLLKDKKGNFSGLTFGAFSTPVTIQAVKEHITQNKVNVLRTDKVFLFTPIYEYQNLRGEGRLEWGYDPWYWQRILYMIAMRWYERKADPPLVGYAPNNTGIDEEDGTQRSNLLLIGDAMGKLRSTGYVGLPSEVFMDDEGRPSNVRAWSIEELAVQDMHPAFLDGIDHFDKKKTRAVFAPDIALSRDRQAGTLGSTEAIVDVTITMQNQTLDAWVFAVNEYVIKPFLRYNNIKDKAYLTSTGVLQDNRAALKELTMKVLEADMLAEQAWGRIFPQSLTQMVDREGLVRELGVPYRPIDPDAPMPKPAPQEPTQEAKDGKDRVSNKTDNDAKRGSGGGTAKPGKAASAFDLFWGGREGYKMDFAGNALTRAGMREAEAAEDWVQRSGHEMEARETLNTYEKAAIVIGLWWLLRSPKEDAGGKRVAGDKSADALVFDGGKGKVLPPAVLAKNHAEMERRASELEGRGYRITSSGSITTTTRAQAAISSTFAGLPADVRASNLDSYLAAAVAQGALASEGIYTRFQPQGDRLWDALAEEEVQRIVRDNTEGTILNIENIARRNAQNWIERMVMASGRELGLVSDALSFKFNRLYSDLSLEAHLRAAYRRSVVESARKNGMVFFVKIPALFGEAEVGQYDFVVGSHDYWVGVGERTGNPMPHITYGLHHGSKSYWYPVPASERIRDEIPNP
jgi:hypothetical protein